MATSMEKPVPSDDENSDDNSPPFAIPGYADVNDFSQKALRSVLKATRSSNDLPVGDDFDFYSTFRSVRDVLDIEGQRILTLLKRFLRSQNVKGNLSHGDSVEIDDQFDVIMDANDQILERAGSLLDEASGIRKEETKLVITSVSMGQPKTTSSWNKKATTSTGKSSVSYSLMTARNIQRPQLQFRDKIDNSNLPFKPQLRVKPNPVKPLEESLQLPEGVQPEDVEKPDFSYPNPYQAEMDAFSPSSQNLQQVVPQKPKPMHLSPLIMVTTEKGLLDMVQDLKKQSEIAVDLEHHSYRSFQGITCLIQISTRTHDYIVDALELRSYLNILNEVFTDPDIVKVLHGADSDIGWLQRDFSVYIVNMFDTGQAARVLGLSRFSLAHLLMNYCQVEADKQFQLADWRIRPLPQELINYAREDTHFLLYIYDLMRNQLLDCGNSTGNLLTSVYERSKAVAAKVFQKPMFTPQDYLELYKKSKKVFNNQQLACLSQLYAWRDGMARVEDESLGYVLPNHMLLQIAEILPRERQGVLACCNPIPPLVRQSLMEIHAMILLAREVALIKVEKRPVMQPSNLQHPKYDVDSLLNCPHDMSHMDERMDELQNAVTEQGLISQSASMFNKVVSDTSSKITLKSKPAIAAYGWKKNQVIFASIAKEKTNRIKKDFINPFAKFLPSAARGDSCLIQPQSCDMWILKASNVPSVKPSTSAGDKKRKAEPVPVDVDTFEPEYVPPSKRSKSSVDSPVPSSSSKPKSIFSVPEVPKVVTMPRAMGQTQSLFKVPETNISSNTENSVGKKIKSLREEVNIKKKKKKKALREKQKKLNETEKEKKSEQSETDLSEFWASQQDEETDNSNNSSTPQPASSTPLTAKSNSPNSTVPVAVRQTNREKKKLKKNKKLTMEEVEQNFSEFDYTAAGQAVEKKKKQKKNLDIFNPSLPSRTGKDKNKAKKPRLSGSNCNKLVSFGPSTPGQSKGKTKKK